MTASAPAAQMRGFAAFVELERRARLAATTEELAFLMVNDTCTLARYRQAVLVVGGRVRAVSGLVAPEPEAPFTHWVGRLFDHLAATESQAPRALGAADVPEALAREWAEWLPSSALWVPLVDRAARRGAFLLARDGAWTGPEIHLLGRLGEAYGHAWSALERTAPRWRRPSRPGRRRLMAVVAVAVAAAAVVPVHQSALAPAEIIARDPVVVAAPVDGVVERFAVSPNDPVIEGQPLLALDGTRLNSRLDIARKALEVAEAEYRQAAQSAFSDPRSKASLAILKGRMEQEAAEVAYLEDLLERILVRSPRAGVAIFNDVNDWVGRPVRTGERLVLVADPATAEVEILLPVGEALALEEGARVRVFLNTEPHRPLEATLRYAAYQAAETPAGVLAYRLVARLADDAGVRPRIGAKGTAKVHGPRTLLVLHLLRRPVATLRQWIGL
ncbi:efflux RND transporter periplasmic adaptor subunit [Novispirillum sp. DQ9]|uniref:efflux RND transporter periplasmic adaptor subunit n=1 Tax=Novispirillum sp. DQ9 TaxID=3398612 RepID=UPI003C7E7F86